MRLPLKETSFLLKNEIRNIYEEMANIDQRLRGKGFPDSVTRYIPKKEISISEAFVEERMSAEFRLLPKKKKRIDTIYKEHPFWFWFIGIIIGVIGLILKCFI